VNVISKAGLKAWIAKHPSTEAELLAWHAAARRARWECLADVRESFGSADLVGEVLIFDIGHNRFRLITTVYFPTEEIYIKALLTHKEYDREEWKKWC
jgi:mRNA interferase HigB